MASVTTATPVPPPVYSPTPAAQPPPGQPDISYHPDWDKYQARVARRLQTEDLPKHLPAGFPKELKGDLVWDGDTLAQKYDWTYVLSETQLDEIDSALAHFKSLNLALGYITRETFPLPTLHAELRRLSRELHFGHGFFVLRGLDVDRYSRQENIIIYTGVSSHIGSIRGRQDAYYKGERADVVIGHIKDVRSTLGESRDKDAIKIGSPAYTADKQVFHTDSGDIVSLFALSTAASGGASRLASTWRVYNHLAATRPDLIHTLSGIWEAELFTKTVDDKDRFMSRPLLYHQPASADGKTPDRVILQYGRRYYVGFGELPRRSHLPPITEAQAEALDAIHFLGERFSVSTNFEKGDMQYVNNCAIFHSRDAFVDTKEKQRHLLRQWLRDPEYAWETPAPLAARWDRVFGGVTPELQTFPLEPHTRSESTPITKASN
ncbi:Taurine catabolism dioxygenase TauD, TfdA family [Geosmithia morbida]|uniref:Taurine catabolism dioxygenase TauD, TfdA family n=1 Tax=Geosmithia morbida TaxID=1094350 RepID=A0A9P5D2N4_9HYPO|nr:Taurine catabolism dioxygenase TauD, TfdA family [Geosmithia morbida]KAF4119674.1 Taurine catabolism dioxygenase TauD, TfdA family [Geosmithia morbida]